MAKSHRVWMICAVIVCFVSAQGNATLFASEDERPFAEPISVDEGPAAPDSPSAPLPPADRFHFTLDPGFIVANPSLGVSQSDSAFAGQVRRGRPYGSGRSRSIAALTIGTIAAIAGAAILVYANRPECNTSPSAGGCGYGTKVIGGAVLTGGVAGLVIGALTWR